MNSYFIPETKEGNLLDKYFYLRGKYGLSHKEALNGAKLGVRTND